MKITLKEITIREVVADYIDNAEEGVTGYGGKLNIRPKYQREFIYDRKERNAVIDTIQKGFPLNVMYWVVSDDGNFEVMDGQQRTISFCQYVKGDFSVDVDGYNKAFHNLTETEKAQILDYKLSIYFCEGNDKEKLEWFETINIAGKKLTEQEQRNAIYTGAWLTAAKTIFSKLNCVAYSLAKDYVIGSAIRQEILQTAISWFAGGKTKIIIAQYMSVHQHDPNANELWTYFKNVIEWVKLTFPAYRHEMKGIDWGTLYNEHKDRMFDTAKLEQEIQALMMDDDISKKSGVYQYILTRNEKYLNIRTFTEGQKRTTYERQKGICPKCGKHFELKGMEADHITPWSKEGKTITENCQMLCKECNRRKSAI